MTTGDDLLDEVSMRHDVDDHRRANQDARDLPDADCG